MGRLIILLILIFFSGTVLAQNEANIWYFGDNAGVDFNGGAPSVLLNGALSTGEGCATISDNTGSVLFYTDGITAYNANHATLANGTGLLGNSSSTQSAIIVKQPGVNTIYYLFTVDNNVGPNGLCYSEVDMSLNGGLGGINANKNILIAGNTCEKITAISHANGTDFWIVSHLFNSNSFVSYLLTSTGLNTTPVTSNVGLNISGVTGNSIGYLKANIDGTKLASANWGLNNVELFDFNSATGVVSNPITFTGFTNDDPYGVEFSPNNQVFYISEAAGSSSRLLQYDLNAGTPAQIINSRFTVATWSNYMGAIQLAPDQRIYQTRYGEEYLAVVNNPNVLGAGCNYVANGFYLGGQECRHGLPTFYNSIISPPGPFVFQNLCEGDSTSFTFNAAAVDSVLWNFGDPASGIHNTTTQFQPTHVFSDSGYFEVTLIAYFGANVDTLTDSLYITALPEIDLGMDTTLCAGDLWVLVANSPSGIYNWSTGSTNSSITVNQSGNYWVEVSEGLCSNSDTINISYNPLPIVNFGNDTALCDGDVLLLDATLSNGSYLWQNNSTSSNFNVSQAGVYSCQVTVNGCIDSDSIIVGYNPIPMFSIGNDTSICVGESITLNANLAGGTYLWSNSGINQTTTVNVPGTYWVDVTVNNCTNRDTLILGNTPLPAVNLGNDTTLCQGDELMLDATLANATYVWNNYTFASTYLVNQAGTYWVEVSVDNCVNSDTLNISYNPLPVFNIGNDTTLCQGDELIVDVGFPGASYLWNNGSTQPSFQMVQEGTYWVEVTFNNCSFIDSMLVEFTANPIVNIGNDTTICQGDVLNLDATQVNASYNWFDNSNGSSITVDTAGIYWVEVTVDNCSSLDSLVLDMDFAPFANLGSDTTICIGKSLVLNAAIENGSYLWQDNSTAENLFINEPGNYWIELGNNCGVDSDSIEVAFEDCNCYIYVPNAFSPNADGRNDIIMPKSNCGYLEYTFQIFNRWGDLVFETTSPRNGWTGIEGKEDAPQGVYVYLLTYQFPEGKRMMKKGSITLIR